MIRLEIHGWQTLSLAHAVFDVNGTLAVDGVLREGVIPLLSELKQKLTLHLLTANTHGKQQEIDRQLSLQAVLIEKGREAEQKAAYVRTLGADQVVAIGQGANDAKMLGQARLGICVLSEEGTALQTLQGSDILVPDIYAGINLLLHPRRLLASLRH